MDLKQIQTAVLKGKTVHWTNNAYVVIYSEEIDKFLIRCTLNDNYTGLTWNDGKTMNGKAEHFYIGEND